MRRSGIPTHLESAILSFLESQKSLDKPQKLSESILKLSDFFINPHSKETPWSQAGAQEAYASYFLPLGVARAHAVIVEAQKLNFFSGLESYVDFGSGPGTISFAFENIFKGGVCVESSEQAISLHKSLGAPLIKWIRKIEEHKRSPKTLLSMSYSLNELQTIPNWIFDFDAIMILEPATQKDFIRLAELRGKLIEKQWHIWAPCTHAQKCPLSGARDWCHDRVEYIKPQWWDKIEEHLPIKNKTITFSYLLARKDKAPELVTNSARLVGDQLEERGKTRQMVCRGPEREFLSWLHKSGPVPTHFRGENLVVPLDTPKHGNELRLKK